MIDGARQLDTAAHAFGAVVKLTAGYALEYNPLTNRSELVEQYAEPRPLHFTFYARSAREQDEIERVVARLPRA